MPIYTLMTKLAPETLRHLDSKKEMGRAWYDKVKENCPGVKWLHHFALLGPFDFMDIYEADSDAEAAKVSMITLSQGAADAQNWPVIEYKEYLKILKDLEEVIK